MIKLFLLTGKIYRNRCYSYKSQLFGMKFHSNLKLNKKKKTINKKIIINSYENEQKVSHQEQLQ